MPQEILEELLNRFKPTLAADYEKYRNHVYRVFMNCRHLDPNESNTRKYAIAAVFHDIGIWTNKTFDYLQPSIMRVEDYLKEINQRDWIPEITQMIYWHHKIKSYNGDYAATTEFFRKADWIDVSLGLLKFGVDSKKLKESRKNFPNKGFHVFLLKQTMKTFLKHPFNPIPVLKR